MGTLGALDLQFGWSFNPNASPYDYASFRPTLSRYTYRVNGTPRAAGYDEYFLMSDGPNGEMIAHDIRCDRNVAQTRGKGCVFHQASPVFTPDPYDIRIGQSYAHVRDAQRIGSPGQTTLSPGRFKLKAGTRAIADSSGNASYQGLQRSFDDAMTDQNRKAACTGGESALIRTRPRNNWACTDYPSTTCTCDEYPFASTTQGAFNNADASSVRAIAGDDHSRLGGSVGNFYVYDRVFPAAAAYEPFWVKVD